MKRVQYSWVRGQGAGVSMDDFLRLMKGKSLAAVLNPEIYVSELLQRNHESMAEELGQRRLLNRSEA